MKGRKVKEGGAFAEWLRALRGSSGVYLIRMPAGFWVLQQARRSGKS